MPWCPSDDNLWWRPRGKKYFDTSLLLPADVLLFSPARPTSFQFAIRQFQENRQKFPPVHSRFTHAALYVGYDHLLCESLLPQGVVYSSLEATLRKPTLVRVRRFPDLTEAQRYCGVDLLAAW